MFYVQFANLPKLWFPLKAMKLSASNLVKQYRKRKVVDQISLELEQGEIVGLLGPNGAGKTTTFYMIVGNYLSEYEGKKLTIKHLLSMSSTIDYHEAYKNPFAYTAKTLYGRPVYQTTLGYKMDGEPGKILNYRSGETQLLSFILSKATKQSIAEYASEKIWQPMGAENNALWALSFGDSLELAYCCLSSTARDFAKIGQLWMNKGIFLNGDTLVNEDFWQRSIKPADLLEKDGQKNKRYGYQWWIGHYKGESFFYMNGLNGQFVLCMPNKEIIVLRLGNKKSKKDKDYHCPDIYKYLDFGLEICRF